MSRTLVKSPPELWAECSQASSFARHLSGSFGEIRITRLEPETGVAWEGEGASGTVRIEPSGWGTRVTLTAALPEEPEAPEPAAEEGEAERPQEVVAEFQTDEPTPGDSRTLEPPAPPPAPTDAPGRVGLVARLRAFFRAKPGERSEPAPALLPEPLPAPEPVAVAEAPESAETPFEPEPAAPVADPPPPGPAPPDPAPPDPTAVLSAALDSLGQAHHRPFSRS